ncbi:MAG TPA: hypothetical protein VH560_05445 [Polyangia bacterium]|nr:hypothetical protein [Polyangia bacterium]
MAASVALLVALGSSARAAGSTILILAGGLGADEDRLVEALRIYTGDVDGRLVLAGKAPAVSEPRAVEQLTKAARQEGAEVVVWGSRRADGHAVFYVLDVAAPDLRETEIEPLGGERAAVDVALKVRALLFRRRERAAPADAEATPPAPVAPSSAVVEPLAPATVDVPAVVAAPVVGAPAPADAGSTVVVARPSAERLVRHRLALSAAYELVVPTDKTWLRHALQVGVAVRLGRGKTSPLSLFVDGAWSTRPATTAHGFTVTMSDVPIGAGLLLTRASAAISVSAGPRACLHDFDVSASDGGARSGSSRRYAVGLGGVARADLSLAAYMKVYLGASIEALVPKQQFTIAGQSALDTGAMVSGISAGFEWLLL